MSDHLSQVAARIDAYDPSPSAQRVGSVSSVSSLEGRFADFRPLRASKVAIPEFDESLLPDGFRRWVVDASERMQLPAECIAAPAIVVAGSLVGGKAVIQPKARDHSWRVTPNLWGGMVAPPSRMKSAAIGAALAPLRSIEGRARERHDSLSSERQAKVLRCEARVKVLNESLKRSYKGTDKDDPTSLEGDLADALQELERAKAEGSEPRYVVNDATTEKLGELLRDNPDGLLLHRDELAGWLRSLERDDRKGDREFYLESWNGDGCYTYDRIGRGTVHIPRLCISIVGGIQPGKFKKFVAEAVDGGYAADGLLQRLQLLVWPDFGREWKLVDREPDRPAEEEAERVFQHLDELPRTDQPVCFDPDAQALFFDWLTELEERLRTDAMAQTPAMESHLGKYRSLMPSLALILHFCDSSSAPVSGVSLGSAQRAAAWCDLLEAHARKVYSPELDRVLTAGQALAEKIRTGAVRDGDSLRQLYRSGWARLTTAEQVRTAAALLEEHGWLVVEKLKQEGGGRPTDVIRLNPAALEGEQL